ncbi:MAG TPA: hypothetical protein VIJ28_08250 [Chloroflexota bacterium]|jgi:hypothetical protein
MQRSTQPTYQQGLGAIGRYLDQYGFEDLLLCELDDGFVGRVTQGGKLVEAIPFPVADLQTMVRQPRSSGEPATQSRGASQESSSFIRRALGGYQEFLGALGAQCDLLQASAILVIELADEVLFTFRAGGTSDDLGESLVREFLYDDAGVRQLLLGNAPTFG